MSDTKVKTIDVDGAKVDIYVSSAGMFQAQLDGEWIEQPTLKTLEEKVRKSIRNRGKLNIEATLVSIDGWRSDEDKPTFENIVITGKHASNDNVLYRGADGRTSQMRSYSDGKLCRRLTTDEKKELAALVRARTAARKAVEAWMDERHLNASKAIDDARRQGTIE